MGIDPMKRLKLEKYPNGARLPPSPNLFSPKGRRGTEFKVSLLFWERDLGWGCTIGMHPKLTPDVFLLA